MSPDDFGALEKQPLYSIPTFTFVMAQIYTVMHDNITGESD